MTPVTTGTRRVPLPTVLLLVLVLAAGVFAVRSGVDWYAAANDEQAAFAQSREEALAAGKQAVQNMHTLDHREVTEGLDRWEDAATGPLLEQLREGRELFEEQIRTAGTVTTATVLSGAVTRLDDRAGTAAVLIALRVTVEAPDESPAVKESRMLGELIRTDDGWKLGELAQAPIGHGAE
jgi:Mce-associated membrane protein